MGHFLIRNVIGAVKLFKRDDNFNKRVVTPTFDGMEVASLFITWLVSSCEGKLVKPWPNGLASERKFSTCVYLRLRLSRACVHLRSLAMTCSHFGRDQICTQVDASFLPFGHPTQVSASWVTSINLLLANEMQDISALKWFFATFVYSGENLRVRLATQRKFLRKLNLWQLATTCESVWPGL